MREARKIRQSPVLTPKRRTHVCAAARLIAGTPNLSIPILASSQRRFRSQELTGLSASHDSAVAYLCVSGGTQPVAAESYVPGSLDRSYPCLGV
jgi:hypothetical protein